MTYGPFSNDLEGETIAVVGGARGIGEAVARRLTDGGARVVVLDRDADAAEAVASGLVGATHAELDVTDAAAVEQTVQGLSDWAPRGLRGVVNCAGIVGTSGRPSHEIETEDFLQVLNVNLVGAFNVSRAVLPGMVDRGYGRVLHVASIAGKDGNAGMVSYSASKAGLIGMVKSQGKEYAESGVTVNALAPAVIRTDLVEAMPEEQVRYMTDKIPMRRLGRLEECAELIAWIVSPACSFTTGFTFDLSGGRAVY